MNGGHVFAYFLFRVISRLILSLCDRLLLQDSGNVNSSEVTAASTRLTDDVYDTTQHVFEQLALLLRLFSM